MNTYLAPPQSRPFELGDPASFGGLTLIPLFPAAEPRLEYIGLDEAIAGGLAVTELDEAGSVSSLFVTNPLDINVLMFEGEELTGAKQNRILDRSVLIQAQSKTAIPVTCVERGRWSYESESFSPAAHTAYLSLRDEMADCADQDMCWEHIDEKSARLDAWSPTDAADEMYVSRGASLEEYLAYLPRRDGQSGSIVCLADRVACLDFVGRSDVYASLYPKLLRGYALDAIERPVDAPVPTEYLSRLLGRICRAKRSATPIVGFGQARRLESSRLVGSELVVGDELVALSVFPRAKA